MTTIGLVGGLGPESTLMYYKEIVARCHDASPSGQYPRVLVNSVDMTTMLAFIERGDLDGLTGYLVAAISDLERAGASFAAIASNTPHLVFDMLHKRCALPLISIVEETAHTARTQNLKRLFLTGTGFTMNARFYAEVFSRYGVDIVYPEAADRQTIHSIIFPDLENGIVRPEKRELFLDICRSAIAMHGIDGLILGCTELPLIATEADFSIPVLDTARIHIDAIVDRFLAERGV